MLKRNAGVMGLLVGAGVALGAQYLRVPNAAAQLPVAKKAVGVTKQPPAQVAIRQPYTLKDLGPVSERAPLGCRSESSTFLTRNNNSTGGRDRPVRYFSTGDYPLFYTQNGSASISGCLGNIAVGSSGQASVWAEGWSARQDLTSLSSAITAFVAEAVAVNSSRVVVGYKTRDLANGTLAATAMLWQTSTTANDNTVTAIVLAQSGRALAINDAGQVAGQCGNTQGALVACYFDAARNRTDIPGGVASEGLDINATGTVAGGMDTGGGKRGFLWSPSTNTLTSLAPITRNGTSYRNAHARALNAAGVAVGKSWEDGGYGRATIWLGDGRARDLNGATSDTSFTLVEAWDITSNGTILCDAWKGSRRHAVELVPTGARWLSP